ncbi:Uncharacterised protein at_DN1570, partial [Pycnogonum litorale]
LNSMIQWNYRGLRAKYDEILLLISRNDCAVINKLSYRKMAPLASGHTTSSAETHHLTMPQEVLSFSFRTLCPM